MGLFDFFKKKDDDGGGRTTVARRLNVRSRFDLGKESISGTMSRFYKAYDLKEHKYYGLKILDPEKTKAFEDRFKGLKKPSEGEISARMRHKNIVKTFEFGTTTQGEPYLLQEYIDGPGLNSVLLGSGMELLEGNRTVLIRQIAEALAAVHAAGFIHRDVCPRNVMVDTEEGQLKLIDFGLSIPSEAPFLQPGNRTGNPNYMAPELVRRQKTDARVDVFAFGVTAFEICTGDLPWSRGLTGKAAMDHASKPPLEITKLRPQINPTLAEAIMNCVEQEPAKRCKSMEEFLRKIQRVETDDA